MIQVRPLEVGELEAAWQLGRLAFGSAPTPAPTALTPLAGLTRYGAFDSAGQLLGKAVDLHHEQWWAGRRVTAADVAGVAVAAEARGRGVARALLRTLLAEARERGAAISALYPTVTGPYRSCGWEVAGAQRAVELPTVALPAHRPAPELTVRAGRAADLPAVAALYERVARHRCGLLTREDVYDPEPSTGLPDGLDGLTLVEQDGRLVGYAAWARGRGYDRHAILTVEDVFATTAAAARELVGFLAGWRSVTPTVRLWPLAHDAVAAQLPLEQVRVHEERIWMHRPVDVARAVADRGWRTGVRGRVDFALTDADAPWNSGFWRLEVDNGEARLHRIPDEPDLSLDVRGFALLYTGAADAYAVAEAGLLRAGGGADPRPLDLLGSGPRAEAIDYF